MDTSEDKLNEWVTTTPGCTYRHAFFGGGVPFERGKISNLCGYTRIISIIHSRLRLTKKGGHMVVITMR
jgi:hypothetical protein